MLQVYKNILCLSAILCMATLTAIAKDAPQYAVDKIPAELSRNANAVVRTDETVFEIISEARGKQTSKYAVTILKEGAIKEASFIKMYNKYIKVNEITGTIYNAQGKRVKRIKKEDIQDYSAITGFSMYEDNRIKSIDPEYMEYPFTIEYTYSTEYKSLFFMPSWHIFPGYNIAVENTSYTVKTPPDYHFRYKELDVQTPSISQDEQSKTYQWTYKNFKALNYEPVSPHPSTIHPCVFAEPSQLTFNNYMGNFKSWNEIGKFIHTLNKDMDILPTSTQEEIRDLIKDAANDYEKVDRIYQYSQKKNRYISIQVGIGGWQPFPAETVDRLSYGDCKALSNYIKALLKVGGIDSKYALVNAGSRKRPVDPRFPSNSFNHAFLCVPLANDTLWLECTSSTSPCGFYSDFTDDRNVLLIDDNGGKLVRTPAYKAEENRQSTVSTIEFDSNNGMIVNAEIKYTGTNYGDEYYLLHRDEKDRRKRIINSIDIPNFNLINYELDDQRSRKPVFTKKLELEATNYCTQMGNRTLVKLNLFNALNSIPRHVRNRQNPVFIQRNSSQCDTLSYKLPAGMSVEALPEKVELETAFGTYKSHAELHDGKIIYHRYFQINKGTFPKEEYNNFRTFLEQVSVADKATTVLIPKS